MVSAVSLGTWQPSAALGGVRGGCGEGEAGLMMPGQHPR